MDSQSSAIWFDEFDPEPPKPSGPLDDRAVHEAMLDFLEKRALSLFEMRIGKASGPVKYLRDRPEVPILGLSGTRNRPDLIVFDNDSVLCVEVKSGYDSSERIRRKLGRYAELLPKDVRFAGRNMSCLLETAYRLSKADEDQICHMAACPIQFHNMEWSGVTFLDYGHATRRIPTLTFVVDHVGDPDSYGQLICSRSQCSFSIPMRVIERMRKRRDFVPDLYVGARIDVSITSDIRALLDPVSRAPIGVYFKSYWKDNGHPRGTWRTFSKRESGLARRHHFYVTSADFNSHCGHFENTPCRVPFLVDEFGDGQNGVLDIGGPFSQSDLIRGGRF